jgi:hypothetical protein
MTHWRSPNDEPPVFWKRAVLWAACVVVIVVMLALIHWQP